SGFLLRYDILRSRLVMASAAALLFMIGLAYWLNILPPIWGYDKFGFLFPHEQEQAAIISTPIPAISSGAGGQMAVPNLLRVSPADGTQEVKSDMPWRIGFDLPMDRASVE